MKGKTMRTRAPKDERARGTRLILATATLGLLWPAAASAVIVQVDSIQAKASSFSPDPRLLGRTSTADDETVSRAVNKADCTAYLDHAAPVLLLTWSWLQAPLDLSEARWTVKIAPPGKTCNTEDLEKLDVDSGCLLLNNTSSFGLGAQGQQIDINVKHLLGDIKCDSGQETTAKVYFLVRYRPYDTTTGLPGTTLVENSIMNIAVDLAAPGAPTISSVNAGGKSLKVDWKLADGESSSTTSKVYWSAVPFDTDTITAAGNSKKVSTTNYHITGLTNGKEYYVGVTAIDRNGNESTGSKVEKGTPIEVQDMYQYYKASGGASDAGYYGCSAARDASGGAAGGLAGGALALVLALMALVLARRRQFGRTGAAAALLLTLALLAAPHAAQAASPRTASIDARFGYYTPQIDSEFASTNKATPYADIMVDSALAKSFSVDWRLLHGFGELSAGFGFAYWTKQGTSRSLTGDTTEDKNELMVLPVSLDLVYRFNPLAEHYNFPLVPYGKVGVMYTFWWSYDGNGEVSEYTDAAGKTTKGRGAVAGLHWTAGLRLLLDIFEPQAAKSFDMELGVNHSYLFAEYQSMSINNFGDGKALDLSDNVVFFGLAFDI